MSRRVCLAFLATGVAAGCSTKGEPAAKPRPPGKGPPVSLVILKADAAWESNYLSVQCDVALRNTSGSPLKVASNFFSAFDGLAIVVMTRDGKEIRRQGYTWHQSPYSTGRTLELPVGWTEEGLVFPVSGIKGRDEHLKVKLVGGLPGTPYESGLASNTVAVSVSRQKRPAVAGKEESNDL